MALWAGDRVASSALRAGGAGGAGGGEDDAGVVRGGGCALAFEVVTACDGGRGDDAMVILGGGVNERETLIFQSRVREGIADAEVAPGRQRAREAEERSDLDELGVGTESSEKGESERHRGSG
jgi:hypothetical protein